MSGLITICVQSEFASTVVSSEVVTIKKIADKLKALMKRTVPP
jgi:hypothetical protein